MQTSKTGLSPGTLAYAKPVVCFYVRTEDVATAFHRAIYLQERTMHALIDGISKKFRIQSRIPENGIYFYSNLTRIIVNHENIGQLPDGQDIIVQLMPCLEPVSWQLKADNLTSGASSYGSEASPFTPVSRTRSSAEPGINYVDGDSDLDMYLNFDAVLGADDDSLSMHKASTRSEPASWQDERKAGKSVKLPSANPETDIISDSKLAISNVSGPESSANHFHQCSHAEPATSTSFSAQTRSAIGADQSSDVDDPLKCATPLRARNKCRRQRSANKICVPIRPHKVSESPKSEESVASTGLSLTQWETINSDAESGIDTESGMGLNPICKHNKPRVRRRRVAQIRDPERKAAIREQNRVAAQKCRETRSRKTKELQAIYLERKTENAQLHALVNDLEDEIGYLANLVLEHSNCVDIS